MNRLIGVLVLFLIASIAAASTLGYLLTSSRPSTIMFTTNYETNNVTQTVSAINFETVTTTLTLYTSGYPFYNGSHYPSQSQLQVALSNSPNARLNLTAYLFLPNRDGYPELDIVLQNVGSEAILISPDDILLNGSHSSALRMQPISSNITFGQYVYLEAYWSFSLSFVFNKSTPGDISTLKIFNNVWTFKYYTAFN